MNWWPLRLMALLSIATALLILAAPAVAFCATVSNMLQSHDLGDRHGVHSADVGADPV